MVDLCQTLKLNNFLFIHELMFMNSIYQRVWSETVAIGFGTFISIFEYCSYSGYFPKSREFPFLNGPVVHTILAKNLGTLAILFKLFDSHPPLPLKTMLVYGRYTLSTYINLPADNSHGCIRLRGEGVAILCCRSET